MYANRATGRRVGRMIGQVDDLGLQLRTFEAAAMDCSGAEASAAEDELEYITAAQDAQVQLATKLEAYAAHINHRDGRS